jgi:hypothetical protein
MSLNVASIYILEVLCFIQKFKGNLEHNYHIHGYKTSGKIDLHTQSCNTALFQKSIVNVSMKLYNGLPDRMKTLSGFKSFEIEVKCLLLYNHLHN